MFHSAKDTPAPASAWQGIVNNDPNTRIPIAWFWSQFGKSQVANNLAVARKESFSDHSFLSTNGVKVIGGSMQPWVKPNIAEKAKDPANLERGLAWKAHLNEKTLASNKEYGVDWLHGTNQVMKHIPHLRSRQHPNVSVRD